MQGSRVGIAGLRCPDAPLRRCVAASSKGHDYGSTARRRHGWRRYRLRQYRTCAGGCARAGCRNSLGQHDRTGFSAACSAPPISAPVVVVGGKDLWGAPSRPSAGGRIAACSATRVEAGFSVPRRRALEDARANSAFATGLGNPLRMMCPAQRTPPRSVNFRGERLLSLAL